MCKSAEQCAERVADRENLVRELVEALQGVIGWVPSHRSAFHTDAAEKAVERARNVMRRAKEQQGE